MQRHPFTSIRLSTPLIFLAEPIRIRYLFFYLPDRLSRIPPVEIAARLPRRGCVCRVLPRWERVPLPLCFFLPLPSTPKRRRLPMPRRLRFSTT
jgi:hypothetical protein